MNSITSFTQKVSFSDSLDFSILTISPGKELYSVFGHTAIRLIDYKNGHDFVFNYGTFDFQTKGFYFKFALGRLDYQLSVERFEDLFQMCSFENRTLIEQKLNLSTEQKMGLLFALIENYRPENRYYRYKFFTDNCATRVRDILTQNISGFHWNNLSKVDSSKTFRQLYRPYLNSMPWILNGIELLLGPMADKIAGYDVMFLPDKLKVALEYASISNVPVVIGEKKLYAAIPSSVNNPFFTPVLFAFFLLVVAIGIEWMPKFRSFFDNIFFTLVGFLGFFILILSSISAHSELHSNLVAGLFSPLLLLWIWFNEYKKKLLVLYSSLFLISGFIILSLFLTQDINSFTYITIFVVLIRIASNIVSIKFNKNIWFLIFNKIGLK
ncbi:MAG: DUF4105 domain-containing protein [Bacteroidales bacterium]|nr:DUF4105 domain-containing protein [Bacteroidales bacterium]